MLRIARVPYLQFKSFRKVAKRHGWQIDSVSRDYSNGVAFVSVWR